MIKDRYSSFITVFIGISGFFSVLFGAWLAHAGQALPSEVQTRLDSALFYQFIHTLALLALVVWYQLKPSKLILLPSLCFIVGILGFSGSLYLKTFFMLDSIAKLAPLGGITLAIGWGCIAIAGKKAP